MSYEPFGYGNRWFDRIGGRRLKAGEFALTLVIVVTVIVIGHFF